MVGIDRHSAGTSVGVGVTSEEVLAWHSLEKEAACGEWAHGWSLVAVILYEVNTLWLPMLS